jgi:tubulin-folding cofactor B
MSVALNALKDFVRQPLGQNQAEETVCLHVTHSNLKQRFIEIRVDLHTTIESLKERLRDRSGTAVESMHLQLFDDGNNKICDLVEDFRPFGYYSPLDGYRIHIIDKNPSSLSAGGWLEDTSLVEKYTISEESYNSREDTFRKYREKKLAEDPTWTLAKEIAMRKGEPYVAPQQMTDDYMADIAASIKVGDRCEVDPGGKRGEVKFVGKVDTLAAGYWIGVQYDEPVGKHDGVVKGKRFFTCPAGHGSMLRPALVKVGDFPERDPFEDELEEI